MNGHREEIHHYTREQIIAHLDDAYAIVEELGLPEYLRATAFDHACRMLSAKNIAIQQVQPIGFDLSQLRQGS